MSALIHPFPYHHDSAVLYQRISHQPWAIFLDSGQALDPSTNRPGSQYGQYDIIVANPIATIVTEGENTTIKEGSITETSKEDPFKLLNQLLNRYKTKDLGVPFAGGALGYFSYDLGRRIEVIEDKNRPENIPEMMVGIYDWAVVVDHDKQKTVLISHGMTEQTKHNWAEICQLFEAPCENAKDDFLTTSDTTCNFTKEQYLEAFDQIKLYIQAGDCYQVNLAQRFSANIEGNSWVAYKKLRNI
ncbi:MAG TPA: aminodeoxychorismate synthase component I, partial [Methylophilaceae bacterium]|nr:aminodeoxychorismate synthase component I [Methylophilaceae bacterium]